MARFIVEVPDSDVKTFMDDDAIVSVGAVYPECDTREFATYQIIGRIDDHEALTQIEANTAMRFDEMNRWARKMEERFTTLANRVDGIAETNNLWDGS